MASWVSLDQQLPLPLRTDVADIAKEVWRTIGGVPVDTLDHWGHTTHCSYVPFSDGSPAVAIINCVRSEPDWPRKYTRYMVDLTRRRVKDKQDNTYTPIPATSVAAVNRVVDWVRGFPERKAAELQREEIEDELRIEWECDRQRQHDANIQEYKQRLAEFDASQPAPSKRVKVEVKQDVPDDACPKCAMTLVGCKKCSRLSCPEVGCPGQGSDSLLSCSSNGHAQERYCSKCRDKACDAGKTLVAACPICQKGFCRKGLQFCGGKQGGEAAAHRPRLLCCTGCFSSQRKLPEPIGLSCVGKSCVSQEDLCPTAVCGECAESFGRRCGEHSWEWWCASNKCAEAELDSCSSCEQVLCPAVTQSACDECNLPASCRRCVKAQRKHQASKTGRRNRKRTVEKVEKEVMGKPVQKQQTGDQSGPSPKRLIVAHRQLNCSCNCDRQVTLCEEHAQSASCYRCKVCDKVACSSCTIRCHNCEKKHCRDCLEKDISCRFCPAIVDMYTYMMQDPWIPYDDENPMGSGFWQ